MVGSRSLLCGLAWVVAGVVLVVVGLTLGMLIGFVLAAYAPEFLPR